MTRSWSELDISDSEDLSIAQGTSQALHYSWRLLESHVGIKYIFPVGSSGTVGRQHKRGSRSHTVQLFPTSHNPVLLTVHGRRLQHPAEDTLFHMASSSEAPSLKLACSPSLFSAMMELANSSRCCTEAQLSREIVLKPKCWLLLYAKGGALMNPLSD